MGYLIGGKFQRGGVVADNLTSEFSRLRAEASSQIQAVPSIKGSTGPGIGGRMSKTGADITRTAPLFYDPRYSHTTLAIPTDERTLNGLYRFYDDTDPIISNAIRLHVEFPLSRVGLTDCGDPGIQKHFEEMYSRINLQDLLFGVGTEYWKIGNTFAFGAWNQSDYMWDQFAVLNPDYVQVESTWLNKTPLIKLIPDDALKRVVNSGSPRMLFQQLPPQIIQYVRLNQAIPLDPANIYHLAHNKTPYERLGKSIIKRILKTMMLEDRYTNAQFAIASRHVVPLTIVKIGDPTSVSGDHLPLLREKTTGKILTDSFDDLWLRTQAPVLLGQRAFVQTKPLIALQALSLDAEGRQRWVDVVAVTRHRSPKEMYDIQTGVGCLQTTAAHGMMWLNPETVAYEPVTVEKLQTREHPTIVSPLELNVRTNASAVFGQPITPELAYFVGLWTTDGCLGDSRTNDIFISNTEPSIVRRMRELANLPFCQSVRENIRTVAAARRQKGAYRATRVSTVVSYYAPELKRELSTFYGRRKGYSLSMSKTGIEHLPSELYAHQDDRVVGALLAGLLDGDGSVTSRSEEVVLQVGASRRMANEVVLMLRLRGVAACVRRHTKDGGQRQLYSSVVAGGRHLRRLWELVSPWMAHQPKRGDYRRTLQQIAKEATRDRYRGAYDFEPKVLDDLFKTADPQPDGYLRMYKPKRENVGRTIVRDYGQPCVALEQVQRFETANVKSITAASPSTKYVYDLVLAEEPHTYMVAGEGWVLTHNTGWIPDQGEIDSVRELFSAHELDPNFSIFFHYGIDVSFYGATGKILPLQSEFDRVNKLKFIGMGISEGLLTGMGTTYATAFATLEVARQRYLHFQLMIQGFVDWAFKTVSQQCGFYKSDKKVFGVHYAGRKYGDVQEQLTHFLSGFTTLRDSQDNEDFIRFAASKSAAWESEGLPDKREYVYPKLDLDLMSLTNDAQYRTYLTTFDKMFPGVRKVSDATFYRLARLDQDAEQRQIEREKDKARALKIKDLQDEKEFQETLANLGLADVKPTGKAPKPGPASEMPLPPEGPSGEPSAPVGANEYAGGAPEEPLAGLESEVAEGNQAEAKQLAAANAQLLKKVATP